MHKKLFIPGPVEVAEDVLQKMAEPMIGHRSKEASALQRGISDKLRIVFQTKEEILLSTSSGSGLMEGAIRSCTAKRAAVFSIGAFGKRWYEMAIDNRVPADLYEVEWGEAIKPEFVEEVLETGKYDLIALTHNETSTGIMNPVGDLSKVIKKYPDVVWCLDTVSSMGGTNIPVDELGVDICITSSQKALGLPPGLAACSFSKKAIERAKTVEHRGYYLDLLKLYEFIQKKDYQYPSTPSLSHMFALDYALNKMLEEGMENRYRRHIEMAEYVRNWAKENFELFGDENNLSNTVTTIKNTRGISVADLNKELGKRGFAISNGYGKLKEKTFRIAHMAEFTLEDIKELVENINDILNL
ncbi:pyridoxal-phosphate-dependent aminotransferase family protein [Clostridium felsineum]|uniref:pyridoxal-phosphate-dependent aminotransferase family protein n=1 Tax=Clostridium felsineum TaxID=36839 RepID=UPI00098C38B2|nr:alanine--glyoxylate aminotransferase family protein [Clostridium felsineum]URZ02762.1 Soluble hydrogenase 42 kDa subunit [Clostridium felsineum]